MKRIIFFTLVAFVLSACGQGEKNTITKDEPSEEQPSPIEEVEVTIAAVTDEEAVELIRSYIAEELDNNAYSGLYLAHEPYKHFVILIQDLYPLQEVAASLENFSKQIGRSEGEYRVKLKPATYSYQTLEKVANRLSASHEEIIDTERRVLSIGINEVENRIDLYVSTREDLNEELIDEITAGIEGIVRIEEGVMGSVDDNGLPTAEPYIVGTIMEKNEAENIVFLIEDQIYVSVNSATVIKDIKGNTIGEEQLNVGDRVTVWTDGSILESLPASGYAVAIQLQ
ncbi:DUF3221 domain-containing protein [Cytobacillus depressus]|uniref:DUF3221 domain-containing protein n=1 Tax=Cytobacillus depressus TaxID=1602942 RepID=A0A6L3UX41_9BACI|nr:DUF3221 domain-containing protein [Cytobacillus depressus]KAB2328690.1 DUF3221 domain-containing protein [Cytobacillus depressus]